MTKISIIGAGSVVWSRRVIQDLCLTPSLHSSTIVLMDIDEERLKLIYAFARRYASEVGANLSFEKTIDRKEALRDADFVINAAMAGGHQYYEKMRAISEKYGYYRGINSVEWNMVSDYHTIWGYYQFKLMMSIARDIEDLCPNAWLILIANPVFEGTTLIARETKVKVIGLCHGHLGYRKIAKTLALNPDDVEFQAIGFNHLIWLTKFNYKGENSYHLIDEWIKSKAQDYWKEWYEKQTDPFDIDMAPVAVDLYKTYGLYPVGDTVRNTTWKYHWNLEVKKRWYGPTGGPDSEIGWKIYLGGQKDELNKIAEAVKDTSIPLISRFPPEKSNESVIPIIDSIMNDKKALYQVNILNQGVIEGIPNDVAVEVPAYIDGKGIHRISVGRLPKRIINYVLYPRLVRMEWALEAFLEGGRDLLFDWLIVDPRTKSNEQVEKTIDALLSIPENKEMAKHFK
jgi:alpha-galactosidase